MSMNVFTRTAGVAAGEAVTYELVYALSQWSNTQKAMLAQVSNGELVEIGVGVALEIVGYYGLSSGSQIIAAFGITTGTFLLVDGIASIVKRNFLAPTFRQIAQVRPAPRAPVVLAPPPSITSTAPTSTAVLGQTRSIPTGN
jgi:hypothetical protein